MIASEINDHPESYEEAIPSSDAYKWRNAIGTELEQIVAYNTREKCNIHAHRKVISTKFVFKNRRNSAGEVARYKVRYVAYDFKQKFVINFEETHAPVVDYDAALTVFSHFYSKRAELRQVDFVTAFLNGNIEEEIYVNLQSAYDSSGTTYKLRKSLYGLKHSPRNWYKKLCETLHH